MVDVKISNLTELSESPATDDLIPIVDQSGVITKKIKAQYLLSPPGRVNLLGVAALMSVWSQSDTNKGLGTLVYDNLAGGTFSRGDTITGATSGATCKVISDNGTTTMVIGAATPPYGIVIFAMGGVVKDVPMYRIFKGAAPFVIAGIICELLVVFFPQIATFLPSLMMG